MPTGLRCYVRPTVARFYHSNYGNYCFNFHDAASLLTQGIDKGLTKKELNPNVLNLPSKGKKIIIISVPGSSFPPIYCFDFHHTLI